MDHRQFMKWAFALSAAMLSQISFIGQERHTASQASGQASAAPPSPAAIIETIIENEGLEAARRKMEEMVSRAAKYPLSERDLIETGYRNLARNAFQETIAVFEFNVRSFPASDNVYDSLAETWIAAGDSSRADATLKAWFAKSPHDTSVARRVAEFRAHAARRQEEHGYLPGQSTGVKGEYFGQTPPGNTPRVFAPGIISQASTSEYACTLSPDGKEFYFTRAGTPQIIMVSRLETGGWTFPEPAPFSAGFSAHEPHISLDNKRIYWGWFRPIPAGEPNLQKMDYGIWASERRPGGWSAPSFVGQGMFVTSTENGEIYVTDHTELPNSYLARARMAGGRFAGLDRLKGGVEKLRSETNRNLAHPAIAPDGSYIVFDVSGGSHLFLCFRNAVGSWGDAIDLAQHGIDPIAGIASISPDGKYLFFGMRGDIYWVSTEFIEKLKRR
jgi:hypothetical protein